MLKVKRADLLNADVIIAISNILNRGNQAEVKREKDQIVVVEVKRKALSKTSITLD